MHAGSVGDTLQIKFNLTPLKEGILTAVGGLPRIVREGKISIEYTRSSWDYFVAKKHPRTAIGINREQDKLYIVVVDGRQQNLSIGMSLEELAQFLIDLGAYDALNLDGGGSTTMWYDGRVVNSPSDAEGDRAVGNALLIYKR